MRSSGTQQKASADQTGDEESSDMPPKEESPASHGETSVQMDKHLKDNGEDR